MRSIHGAMDLKSQLETRLPVSGRACRGFAVLCSCSHGLCHDYSCTGLTSSRRTFQTGGETPSATTCMMCLWTSGVLFYLAPFFVWENGTDVWRWRAWLSHLLHCEVWNKVAGEPACARPVGCVRYMSSLATHSLLTPACHLYCGILQGRRGRAREDNACLPRCRYHEWDSGASWEAASRLERWYGGLLWDKCTARHCSLAAVDLGGCLPVLSDLQVWVRMNNAAYAAIYSVDLFT